MPDELLTYKEIVRLVKVNRKTIARWVAAKRFPLPIDLNGEPRWVANEVYLYLARLQIDRETKKIDLEPMGQKGTEGDSVGHRSKQGKSAVEKPTG